MEERWVGRSSEDAVVPDEPVIDNLNASLFARGKLYWRILVDLSGSGRAGVKVA